MANVAKCPYCGGGWTGSGVSPDHVARCQAKQTSMLETVAASQQGSVLAKTEENPEVSFSTAWAIYNRERVAQGLGKSELRPNAVTDKYEIAHKKDGRSGETYYAAYVKESGKTQIFKSRYKAETWAKMHSGEPLSSDDQYAYKSLLNQVADDEEVSSERPDGSHTPVLIHQEPTQLDGPPQTFRVYKYKDKASPTGESWHADFDYPDPLVKDRVNDGGRLWEGDKAPTRDDLLGAVENYFDSSD